MANTTGKKWGGRKKGTPNKDNELKVFLKELMSENQEKLKQELNTLKGKSYVDAIFSLMEYVQPKLSRAEVIAEVENVNIDVTKYTSEELEVISKIRKARENE